MRTGSGSGQGSIWCGFGADGSLQVRVSDAIVVVQLNGDVVGSICVCGSRFRLASGRVPGVLLHGGAALAIQ